jgi:uncharacterized LabA/DUF88 family protein
MLIDLENLRYTLLNNHGQEPDIAALVAKATKYGRPTLMKAYADFSEHPSELKRQLHVSGVDAIDIPVKRTNYTKGGKPVERIKNAADMVLALDAITEALEADTSGKKKTFLLVAGDRDYIRLVTLLRNRFGQNVVIAGVPGSVAKDLVKASGCEPDPVEVPPWVEADKHTIKSKIAEMVKKGPSPFRYWSVRLIDQWVQDHHRSGVPGTAKEKRDAIGELLREKVLAQREITDTKKGKVTETYLDEAQAKVKKYLS